MSKIKTFLTDSQLGYVLSMLLKIWVNLSLNVLIKKVLIKKECKQCSAVFFVKYKCKNKDKHGVDLTTLNRVFQLLKCAPPQKKKKKKKQHFLMVSVILAHVSYLQYSENLHLSF